MPVQESRSIAAALAGCLLCAAPGCGGRSASTPGKGERAAATTPAPAPAPAPAAAPSKLPEDPIAGKRSEEQWREHMREEEHERQLGFDRERVGQHRALVALIKSARARYDRARSAAAVDKVRADMPRRVAELRRRVTKIDHWGVNSPLLPDYDALAASLTASYADARIAAIQGDDSALVQARADFDRRLEKIDEWLTDAAESEPEY